MDLLRVGGMRKRVFQKVIPKASEGIDMP